MKLMHLLPIASIVMLVSYEIWAVKTEGGMTLSEMVWHVMKQPIVPFGFGLLMGHFFL